jgi:hypothetical protein
MATITVPPKNPPTTIERFLGLNEDSTGDTQLELGESPRMRNFRLTENFKMRKREGYEELFSSLGVHDVQGMWYGKLSGTFYFIFACNGNVYKHVAGVNTSIGTLTDAPTFFFSFANKVYMLNGTDYKSWDGTTFAVVAGYIPLIATATPPTGGGSPNEQINLLTGKKRQTFSGNASATAYQLAETALTSVDVVIVGGVTKTVTTDYTVNLTTGIVTFVVAPATGVDNVDIQWTKGAGSRSEITENRFAMLFGGQNDSRVFFYGDGSNRYHYTGLANGVPSAEYLPALNYRDISSSQFAVTDIVRQYDRQLIYTNGGETWYSYYDPITLETGDVVADFPTYPLNDAVGNIAFGQAQLIENNPFTIQNGVYEWVATNVRDERNVSYKSKRVQPSLDEVNLTTAITVDWEARKEYWLAVETEIWIYNYRLDAWYRYELAHSVTSFLVADNEMYIGTPNGQIMKFDLEVRTDNETAIDCVWEMNFYDFNSEWLRKFLNRVWISIQPGTRERIDVEWQTNNNSSSQTYTIQYSFMDFSDVDFGDYSFLTYYNPQPFRLKIKAKKFVYFKLILTNDSLTENATVLSINLQSRMGGESK